MEIQMVNMETEEVTEMASSRHALLRSKSFSYAELKQQIEEAVEEVLFCSGRPRQFHEWSFTGLNHHSSCGSLGQYECVRCGHQAWFGN